MYQYFIPLHGWIIFQSLDIPLLFINSLADKHLFHFSFITNNIAMNITYKFLCGHNNSLAYIHRNRIDRSYGKSMFNFSNNQIVIQTSYIILHSHQQKNSNFSTSLTILILSLLITTMLLAMKWYLTMVWFVCPLVTNDVEHLWMNVLVSIHISFLDKCLLRYFVHFLMSYLFLTFKCPFLKALTTETNHIPQVFLESQALCQVKVDHFFYHLSTSDHSFIPLFNQTSYHFTTHRTKLIVHMYVHSTVP